MRTKNLLVITIALIFLLLALTGCGKSGLNIAFFVYDGTDTFISEMMQSMQERMQSDITAEIKDAANSQAVQNQQIVELLSDDFDMFIINAVDRLACSSIVEKCSRKNVPVIFFNREPLGDALSGDDVFYVGAAADSMGEKQADIVAELFTSGFQNTKHDKNGDGIVQLVILKGEQGHQDAEKRTDNCVNRLKALGFKIEVLAIEVADWRRNDAYEAMRQLYIRFGSGIELVFSNNDDMAMGAIDYLVDAGVFSTKKSAEDQSFIIIGVDGTAVGLEAIREGLLYGTVNNDSEKQADVILTLADYIIAGKDIADFPYPITNEHYIYVDGEMITAKNIDEFDDVKK